MSDLYDRLCRAADRCERLEGVRNDWGNETAARFAHHNGQHPGYGVWSPSYASFGPPEVVHTAESAADMWVKSARLWSLSKGIWHELMTEWMACAPTLRPPLPMNRP